MMVRWNWKHFKILKKQFYISYKRGKSFIDIFYNNRIIIIHNLTGVKHVDCIENISLITS